ncbi:MAG: hypothetical protein CVU57_15475 [Deltaproteobacteria bacterium HGW-Deltaproteobacteria-15]|jgi:hypothetical protein|nr:MAG: hypothetical protein CVU57_15475 [Deltaproteobacteria bacterium HGW-Deltaproteobacteria-15]
MKKHLITAGAALAFFLMWTGVSDAGGRIAYHSSSPIVIHSPHHAVVVHGRPYAHPAWKNRHHYDRYDRYRHRHAGRNVHYDRRGHFSRHVPGAWYRPGFSFSIGVW